MPTSQALGTVGGVWDSPALGGIDSLRPGHLASRQLGHRIMVLCKEEGLWDVASFIRHWVNFFGGSEISASAWRMSRSSRVRGDRNWEGQLEQLVQEPWMLGDYEARWRCSSVFSVSEPKHPPMTSLPNKCFVLNICILWIYSIYEFSYIPNKGNRFLKTFSCGK